MAIVGAHSLHTRIGGLLCTTGGLGCLISAQVHKWSGLSHQCTSAQGRDLSLQVNSVKRPTVDKTNKYVAVTVVLLKDAARRKVTSLRVFFLRDTRVSGRSGGGKTRRNQFFHRFSFRGVKRCAKSNGGCQSDGGRPPDISGPVDWDLAHRLRRNRLVQAAFKFFEG